MSESSAATSILAQLARVTDNDLAELDQEIGSLRQQLTSLQELRRLFKLRLSPVEEQPAGPANKQPVSRRPTRTTADGRSVEDRRLDAARYLLREGPQIPAHLASAIGIPQGGSLATLLDCDWFDRSGGKVELTSKGRMEYVRLRGTMSGD